MSDYKWDYEKGKNKTFLYLQTETNCLTKVHDERFAEETILWVTNLGHGPNFFNASLWEPVKNFRQGGKPPPSP